MDDESGLLPGICRAARAADSPRCPACGFSPDDWQVGDAADVFEELGFWWEHATAGAPEAAIQHGVGIATVAETALATIRTVLAMDGATIPGGIGGLSGLGDIGGSPPVRPGPPVSADRARRHETTIDPEPADRPVAVQGRLAMVGAAMAELADERDAPWGHRGTLRDGKTVAADDLLFAAVHALDHGCTAAARAVAAAGGGAPPACGTVDRINVSGGGVPKRAIPEAAVAWRGVDGDQQADRRHHGRPFQAICLWSSEVIAELATAGHPLSAGAAGENMTIGGLGWRTLRPGGQIRIGSVRLELSYPAVPCAKQARWFSDGDYRRISWDRNPGWVRWYAWVRQPGTVRAGDAVRIGP